MKELLNVIGMKEVLLQTDSDVKRYRDTVRRLDQTRKKALKRISFEKKLFNN